MDVRAEAERHFLAGKRAAEAALDIDTCPYREAIEGLIPEQEELIARINWTTGWKFARFVALQRGRATHRKEIVEAMASLLRLEEPYARHLPMLLAGRWPHPIRYHRTYKATQSLMREAWNAQATRFLKGLGIEPYFPWLREFLTTIQFFDKQLALFSSNDSEDEMRKLLARFGDAHGVREAWHAYCSSERMDDLVEEARRSLVASTQGTP